MADITISRLSYNKQTANRLFRVTLEFMGGKQCRYCAHSVYDHAGSAARPYFLVVPWEGRTKHHEIVNGETLKAKNVVLQRNAALTRLYCLACAKERDTSQVVCYQRTIGIGEVLDIRTKEVIEPHTPH